VVVKLFVGTYFDVIIKCRDITFPNMWCILVIVVIVANSDLLQFVSSPYTSKQVGRLITVCSTHD
jgi:hypothetical protein